MIAPRRAFMRGLAAMPLATVPVGMPAEHGLSRLGAQFERAWEREAACWHAFPSVKISDEHDSRLWAAAESSARCTSDIIAQIERQRATTLEGVLVKVRACAHCHSGEPFDGSFLWTHEGLPTTDIRLAEAVLRDLMAIDGRPVPLS